MTEFNVQATIRFLEVFRRRVLFTVGVLLLCAGVSYIWVPSLFGWLLSRHEDLQQLVFISPAEGFFSRVKLSLALGLILTLPFILFQIWNLAGSRLSSERDKMYSFFLIPASLALFLVGAGFGLLAVFPLALKFFMGFSSENLRPLISVSSYVTFIIFFTLPFGLIFELPVVIVFLARLGIINAAGLARHRRYAILAFFIIGALLTPADALSQIMMAVPLCLLYEVSIVLARIFGKPRQW